MDGNPPDKPLNTAPKDAGKAPVRPKRIETRGRKDPGREVQKVSFRLDPHTLAVVKARAELEQVPYTYKLRVAVEEGLKAHDADYPERMRMGDGYPDMRVIRRLSPRGGERCQARLNPSSTHARRSHRP